MDTTIRFTQLPLDFHRWRIAQEREAWEREHGYVSTIDFRSKVFSLVNLSLHCFHSTECESELLKLCMEYSPAYASFVNEYCAKHGGMNRIPDNVEFANCFLEETEPDEMFPMLEEDDNLPF